MNDILTKKFNKEELLERFSQVIDRANDFIDREDVQKVRKLFINAGTDKASQQVAATEAMGLHDKYCTFGDTLTSTALMMAVTGNSII
jgi:DNA-binding response OmpR family regulator